LLWRGEEQENFLLNGFFHDTFKREEKKRWNFIRK
jgi:hypothetical protein